MSGTASRTTSQPGLFEMADLLEGPCRVARVRIAHGLDGDGRVAADLDGAEGDLAWFFYGEYHVTGYTYAAKAAREGTKIAKTSMLGLLH